MNLQLGQDTGERTGAMADRTIRTDRIIAFMIISATIRFGGNNTTGEA